MSEHKTTERENLYDEIAKLRRRVETLHDTAQLHRRMLEAELKRNLGAKQLNPTPQFLAEPGGYSAILIENSDMPAFSRITAALDKAGYAIVRKT